MLDELDLPKASVLRIARNVVSDSVNFAKDTKLPLVKSATHFVLLLTMYAHERARDDNRKTISGLDIMNAMLDLGYSLEYNRLMSVIHAYRELKASPPPTNIPLPPLQTNEDLSDDTSDGMVD